MSNKLLHSLAEVRSLEVITLQNIIEHLKGEALVILCLISILPFLQPIPIPGLSSLLGLIVLLQGVGLMVWGRPLLTQKMRKVIITHERFEQIYRVAEKFGRFTSKISIMKHPVTGTKMSHMVSGLAIIVSAAFLSLPLPIPFSNLIPALSIALICVGLLEEDLVLMTLGFGITLTVMWMGVFSYHLIRENFQSWLSFI